MSQISITQNKIYINNTSPSAAVLNHVFELTEPSPSIMVFEDGIPGRCYQIETLTGNPNLTGQYFHACIRILDNSAVMTDGVISKSAVLAADWNKTGYEGIRLQPFFLSNKDIENEKLKGKGLVQRGLHFSGVVTPGNIRVVCICDSCFKSFTLQHFHAGFSDAQYFYSSDSKQTLVVSWYQIKNMPTQLQTDIDLNVLAEVELQLPKPTKGNGSYKYYNCFRCPHCSFPFIDFEKNKSMRPNKYYGNKLINYDTQHIEK